MELLRYNEGDFYFVDIDKNSETYMGMFICVPNEEPVFFYTMDQYEFLKFRHLYYHTIYRMKEYKKNLQRKIQEIEDINYTMK